MYKKLCIIGIIVLLIANFSGCFENDDNDKKSIPPTYSTITEGLNDYVNSSNEFTFQMYKQLIDSNENVFFSPYSISTALGMAYEGAKGETAEEMLQVFDFVENNQERRDMIKSVQNQLNKNVSSYQLSAANAYWLRDDEQLNEEYKNIIEFYYLAYGQQLDFRGDPSGSANIINNWIEQETNDKIKDMVSSDDITYDTYLILTNAVYFKSNWKYQFDPEATEEKDFTLSTGEEIKAETMHMCDESKKYNYASNSDVQLLQLPYKGEELSMFIMLPKGNNIATLESKLDSTYLNQLKEDMTAEWVDIYLPKFKFEQKYILNQALISMGMFAAFGSGADFSGITSDTNLFIEMVAHQSFVEVNEEGTEAAAATVVYAADSAGGDSSPMPIRFWADHPFIFLIQHKETGQILFMGKVENPNE